MVNVKLAHLCCIT